MTRKEDAKHRLRGLHDLFFKCFYSSDIDRINDVFLYSQILILETWIGYWDSNYQPSNGGCLTSARAQKEGKLNRLEGPCIHFLSDASLNSTFFTIEQFVIIYLLQPR